jgi:hypothetical protein
MFIGRVEGNICAEFGSKYGSNNLNYSKIQNPCNIQIPVCIQIAPKHVVKARG